jgi:hypothetical protein
MTRIISIVGGLQPSTPTIGTATAGDTTASVAFTASSYIGKGTITYTATSSPGGFTGTGSSSPITVSGLTNGTAYTFTVTGTTNYGVSSAVSASSNSITPAAAGSYFHIATTTTSGGSPTTITFSSIPNTYRHLMVLGVCHLTAGVPNATGQGDYKIRMGQGSVDTGSNYFSQYIYANTQNSQGSNQNSGDYIGGSAGWYQSGGLGGLYYNPQFFMLFNYTNTSRPKSFEYKQGYAPNIASGNTSVDFKTGYWNNSGAAVDILQFESYNGGDGLFANGTSFSLYGVI